MKIRELFEKIASTSSKLEKEKLLNDNMSPLLETILKDTYGPEKYNVKKYENLNCQSLHSIDDNYEQFHRLLQTLSKRELTGDAARRAVAVTIGCFEKEDQIWLDRILNKNLKIGAGDKFAEDSGKTEKLPVALANKLQDVKNIDIYDGTWYVSRKLDGCRCLAFVGVQSDGTVDVEFISRQGKKFETLDNLKQPYINTFRMLGAGEYVVDGEVCIIDENGNESFAGLMSEIRKKNHTIENPAHCIFDILTAEEFWTGSGRTFGERQFWMHHFFTAVEDPHLIQLPQFLCTPARMKMMRQKVEDNGWEGLMLRKANVKYEGKRTNNLLKVKKMADAEYIVKDIISGEQTISTTEGSKEIVCTSALVIEHKGNIVKVGSGLTREQRIRWYEHPEEIIGKTITVQYFEETKDKKTGELSLRFPTLKYVYENGRNC